jgi:signal transduction histidine kinase
MSVGTREAVEAARSTPHLRVVREPAGHSAGRRAEDASDGPLSLERRRTELFVLLAFAGLALAGGVVSLSFPTEGGWFGVIGGSPTMLRGSLVVLALGFLGYLVATERRLAGAASELYRRERRAVEHLRQLNDTKDTLLSAVSHELRTPLTKILGFTGILEDRGELLTPESRLLFTQKVGVSARKLERLLSDLIDVDRLSRGMLEAQRRGTDIGVLVERVLAELEWNGARPVVLDVSCGTVWVDPPKVERIIENLLTNAARYTPEGSRVWVRAERDGDALLLRIEDDGSGVSQAVREEIFEPFRRGAHLVTHSPGLGIGLSVVARFAALHGGEAWVEERPGGGASFHVRLPGVDSPD